ncbi:MAG: hypothetical protein AAGI15_01480 [Pseudomonadota bacterium]
MQQHIGIPTAGQRPRHQHGAVLLALLLTVTLPARADSTALIGDWTLNEARSAQVQPENVESRNWLPGGGKVRGTISVGGVQVPTGGTQREVSTGPSSDPGILRCKRLQIAEVGEELRMTYEEVGSERFRQGTWRGVKTSWNRKRLKSRYESTSRKVAYLLELQTDDSLLVTVTIKPRKASKRTYKQIFERRGFETAVPETAADEEATDASEPQPAS